MEEKTIIEVYPISKIKRILVFLGDIFIHYILSVFILQFLVFNIASKITNYDKKLNDNLLLINKRLDILYGNQLLFFDKKENKYNVDKNLDTTFDKFLYYYVNYESDNVEPIRNYFINIKKDDVKTLNNIYLKYGEPFFELNNNQIVLAKDYINYFSPYFDKTDSLSEVGKSYLSSFRKGVFLPLFNYMIEDINKNDLEYQNSSYKIITEEIKKNNSYTIIYNSINISISFLISFLVLFVLVPLIFKDKSTLCEKVMKTKRIKVSNYEYLNKKEYIFVILNNLFMSLTTLFFVGAILLGFKEIFKYNILMIISLISCLYLFTNFLVLCINQYNKSLKELSTDSIMISETNLNEIYASKGYEK